jgi:hypothetical protein
MNATISHCVAPFGCGTCDTSLSLQTKPIEEFLYSGVRPGNGMRPTFGQKSLVTMRLNCATAMGGRLKNNHLTPKFLQFKCCRETGNACA